MLFLGDVCFSFDLFIKISFRSLDCVQARAEEGGLYYLRTANHKVWCIRVPVADYK